MPSGGSAPADGTLALPRPLSPGGRLALPAIRSIGGPLTGRIALGSMILGAILLVAFTSSRPSVLVPHSLEVFPGWQAGPLHWLFSGLHANATALRTGYSLLAIAMLLAYAVALISARDLSLRAIVICIVALHAILLLGPAVQLNDVFNYLGYARLGGLHGLNPYQHVIGHELYDPVYPFSSWRNLSSPYGPLFTALSYPLSWVPLSVAYWLVKVVTVVVSLGVVALVYKCARLRGIDPRFALVFVALNPVYLVFALGGFHNDFFMVLPAMGAVMLVLSGRDRAAGAVLMLAVAIKFSALLLLPFLLLGVGSNRRRVQLITGAAMAAIPLIALSIVLFGLKLPNLQGQTTLLTNFSFPNVVGDIVGAGGGAKWILRVANVGFIVSVLVLLVRSRGDWISRAGWATLALIVSLSWLMPWYLIWLAPLAAIGASTRLRRATVLLTVYLVVCFVPSTVIVLSQHGLDPTDGKAFQATQALQLKLAK